MLGSEFRGLAEAVTRSYGDDPWFFLRELAQNSRDAGARNIWVSAQATGGNETLVFADDGAGMSLEHARRFLFRLYASNKGDDHAAAGRYGIGFWTVLRFQPAFLRIESRCGDRAWAVALDADLNPRQVPPTLQRHGTRITLSRLAPPSAAGCFAADVTRGLRTYCLYLRRNDRKASMLRLWYDGKNLVEPIALPGPLRLQFRSNSVEGAVGLGKKPLVRLYARGLPVWEGALLSQMSHLQPAAALSAEVGAGLAPVFLLNGNHLDVTFSRSLAVENRELARVRRQAERALHRLLAASLETAFPSRPLQRWSDRLLELGARWRRRNWRWLPASLLLLLLLGFFAQRYFPPSPAAAPAASWFSLRETTRSYRGAMVGASAAAAPPFFYRPATPSLFQLFIADTYDEAAGFVRDAGALRLGIYPALRCRGDGGMALRLQAEAGETFLPLAPGHALVPGSLRLNGRPLSSYSATELGETIVNLPRNGVLEYRSCRQSADAALATGEFGHFTRLPSAAILPPELEAAIARARALPIRERRQRALALTASRLAYDASPFIAERYRELGSSGAWAQRVLAIGRGDCDVLNGFLVLLLRKMSVPARLVVGMVGTAGGVSPSLHAWCEHFDGGWTISDATALPLPPPSSSGKTNRLPVAVPPRPRLRETFPWRVFILALALLAAPFVVWLLKKHRPEKALRTSPAAASEPLLQMVQHALLQPDAWGDGSPLWRHRLLPLVGGGFESFARARRLQEHNRLFMTANRNPLACSMAAAGITVLDLGQAQYAPLRALLPGAIDADRLCCLRPEMPLAGSLLAALNQLCRRTWRKAPPFLIAPGLSGCRLLPVFLPASPASPPFFFPQRFIAVHPDDRLLAQCLDLFRRNPALALLRFLHGNGLQLPAAAFTPQRLKRIARRLLRSAHD